MDFIICLVAQMYLQQQLSLIQIIFQNSKPINITHYQFRLKSNTFISLHTFVMITNSSQPDTLKFHIKTKVSYSFQNLKIRRQLNNQTHTSFHQNKSHSLQKNIKEHSQDKLQQKKPIQQRVPSKDMLLQQKSRKYHPMSPNAKRLQQQLQLFRFDKKIQEIQSQQVQQLIQQQIHSSSGKQHEKLSELLLRNTTHSNNSNAFRLYRNSRERPTKGHIFSENQQHIDQIGQNHFPHLPQVNLEDPHHVKGNNRSSMNLTQFQHGDISPFQKNLKKPLKHPQSQSIWKRNTFNQKFFNEKRKKLHKDSFSKLSFTQATKPSSFSSQNDTHSSSKLKQIHQSLFLLKNKSFSLKKNYDYFINESNSINPETKQQLVDELQKCRNDQKLLLDSNNKSFSGYNKMKSNIYHRKSLQERIHSMKAESMLETEDMDHFGRFANMTSYKISYIKPLNIKISPNNKNRNLLQVQSSSPKVSRLQKNADKLNSERRDEDCGGLVPKFQQIYKEKMNEKQVQKYLEQRRLVSRQVLSPYPQLSAWSEIQQ